METAEALSEKSNQTSCAKVVLQQNKDFWTEICGDGVNYGYHEWDDGNLNDEDGCSSAWEYEKCFECLQESSASRDIWSKIFITPAIEEVSSSNVIKITFDHDMKQIGITK